MGRGRRWSKRRIKVSDNIKKSFPFLLRVVWFSETFYGYQNCPDYPNFNSREYCILNCLKRIKNKNFQKWHFWAKNHRKQKFQNHHSEVIPEVISSLIKLMIYHFRGSFMTDNLSDKKRTLLTGKSDNSTDSIWRFGLGRYPSCFFKKSYWVKESFSFTLKCH